jgi:hypothetical protein
LGVGLLLGLGLGLACSPYLGQPAELLARRLVGVGVGARLGLLGVEWGARGLGLGSGLGLRLKPGLRVGLGLGGHLVRRVGQ